jgi:hypothetical protein
MATEVAPGIVEEVLQQAGALAAGADVAEADGFSDRVRCGGAAGGQNEWRGERGGGSGEETAAWWSW